MITAKAITVSRVFNILLGLIFYRFDKPLTRPKNAAAFCLHGHQTSIIHFASNAEELYQHQSVSDKAGNQCLIFLNFATPLRPLQKQCNHFRASNLEWSKPPI